MDYITNYNSYLLDFKTIDNTCYFLERKQTYVNVKDKHTRSY
jgi:hypothetical protein